jgi:L-aspartate oxidase
MTQHPPVVVGAGLAGLTTALALAPLPCLVLSPAPLGGGSASGWAQGGIAAALGDDDSTALHAADTLAAGAGLCDEEAVHAVTAEAPGAVDWLSALGARFDRDPSGRYALGLEGAHSRHRIVHAGGDGSGAEVLRAVVAAVRATPSITVLAGVRARRVVTCDGVVTGVVVQDEAGTTRLVPTTQVVLATGGVGGLWRHTTNPLGAQGQGLALAARCGAELRDLEMVQFHPTALDVGHDPMPLVSEAVRGEGAVLVDASGRPLVRDSLAARDVVARAVWEHGSSGAQAYVDARSAPGPAFAFHFPAVARACVAAGIDPARDLVPVKPAAHYHCGGVRVDLRGRTSVPGLWACGEVASTGLHGANRLASNSLLEAVVTGRRVAADLRESGPVELAAVPATLRSDACAVPPEPTADELAALRQTLGRWVGVLRDGQGLARATTALQEEVSARGVTGTPDALLVAMLVSACALARRESRGGHLRRDHPWTAQPALHTTVRLGPEGTVTTLRTPVRTRTEPVRTPA